MTELHDQRDRDRFQTELDANFCVSAGAGAGKTTAIVRRIAQLARREPDALSRLVVVTYTKSAAEELRVRSRSELLKSASREAGAVLPKFRQAFFGTIHSFCLKLVREFGEGLGIAMDTDLLEEQDEEDVWARYCESPTLDAVPLDFAALAEVTRFLSFDELLELARKIEPAQAERLLAGLKPGPRPSPDFASALADDGGRSKDTTRGHQEMLRRFRDDLASDASFLRIPDFKQGSKGFLTAYQMEMFPFAQWLDWQAARLAAGIALGYRDYRREQGLMTYADQIAWCRALLENAAVLHELRERDWIVLLDEAQDTDTAMFAILTEVTRPVGAVLGDWPAKRTAAPPRAGRFCFVGDEQQSIFASRANLAVYRQYIDAYAAGMGGERLEFSVTMRCPQRVIEVVNSIFFHADRLRQTHFSFRELHARPDCKEGAVLVLPVAPLPDAKPKIDAQFREECRQVAAFLNRTGPAGLGVERWSEIAVLCPRRAWLRDAAEIFVEEGLPARLVSQQRLQLELPQRSWPVALLHVLLNPWDRFELIGVLREIFCVSDVDLADAQADNGTFDFETRRDLSKRLEAAMALLRELRDAAPPAGEMSTGQYVGMVLDRTRLAARLEAIGQRSEALVQLRLEALQAEIAGRPLRAWVAELVRGLRKPAPQPGAVEAEMQLMTCQKAKGLEWPVVIPLGLARGIRNRRVEYPRVEEHGGEIAVHVSKITVDEAAKEPRALAKQEELQRIFYVTLTRAKSRLVLPDTGQLYGIEKDSFMELCKWTDVECEGLVEVR